MMELAKKHRMVIIVPIYEEAATGVYYNTAAVIDSDGSYLGMYRKNHIPHTHPGFWEKVLFSKPGKPWIPYFPDSIWKNRCVYMLRQAFSRRGEVVRG